MPTTALTTIEQKKLATHESVIETGIESFRVVGKALLAIQEDKLYRATAKTFELYCKKRWGMQRRHAYRQIEAAEVIDNLELCPNGTQIEPPTSERQARELNKVEPAKQAEVWQAAVETAPKDDEGRPQVTAAHVAKTVAAHNEPEKKQESAQATKPAAPNKIGELKSNVTNSLDRMLAGQPQHVLMVLADHLEAYAQQLRAKE